MSTVVTAKYEPVETRSVSEHFKLSLCFDDNDQKVISKSLIDAENETARLQLMHQIKFLKNSTHTGIVNYIGNTESELFMEAMGGNLQELLEKSNKQFSAGEIVSFLRQMLKLLTHLDSRNLAVGQLSPRTVLANEELNIFKIPKAYEKNSSIPQPDDNEKIFPPEFNSAEDYDDHASDIYCLGMTCVELALGRAGFESHFKGMYDNSCWERWHETRYENLPPLAEILKGFPPGLTDILLKMIEKPLDQRYSSASDVLNDLNKLGIVDADVTVKQKSRLSLARVLASCAALAIVGAIGWKLVDKPPANKPAPVAKKVAPKEFEIQIESKRSFEYRIVRGDKSVSGMFNAYDPKHPKIKEGDQFSISGNWPDGSGVLFRVLANDGTTGANASEVAYGDVGQPNWLSDDVEIPGLTADSTIKLEFVRKYKLHSSYKDFVWKYKQSDEERSFADTKTVQVASDGQQYFWIKPGNDKLTLGKKSSSDDWFKVELPTGGDNQIELQFELPVEVELVGHSSLSDIARQLMVTVNDIRLKTNQGTTYSGLVPYGSARDSDWNLMVEYKNELIAQEPWVQSIETSDSSTTHRRVELKRKVQFPDNVIVVEVNGETGFQENERRVEVPFGKVLEYTISDREGVVRIQNTIAWEDNVSVAWHEHEHLLSNEGNSANFFLSRKSDPSKLKLIGTTNRRGKIPINHQEDYLVTIKMIKNPQLRQRMPLQVFLTQGSIELQQSSVWSF